MREIGIVRQVQIQQSSLKSGERPYRVYSPAPLLVVESLALASGGVVGLTADGGEIIDVHHADHPQTRNASANGVSFGFTGHYAAMRENFGAHIIEGCAGENILIESQGQVSLGDLGKRLAFQSLITGEMTYLDEIIVAAPCVEFSHWVNRHDLVSSPLPAETVKKTLQFLDDGLRGFYATAQSGTVQAGDRVFMISE